MPRTRPDAVTPAPRRLYDISPAAPRPRAARKPAPEMTHRVPGVAVDFVSTERRASLRAPVRERAPVLARQFAGETGLPAAREAVRPKRRFVTFLTWGLAAAAFFTGVGIYITVLHTSEQTIDKVAHASSEGRVSAGVPFGDEKPLTEDEVLGHQVAAGQPRFLTIDKLGIHARITMVSQTDDYKIDSPKSIYDVGWFDGSARPGSDGAVLLVGHHSGPTKAGVFAQLHELSAGDELSLELGDGSMLRYEVVDKRRYTASDVDVAAALSPVTKGKRGLNLITTGGLFASEAHMSHERVVIFTEQIAD